MNITEIYAADNHILIKSGYGDPKLHRHSAAHILIALKDTIEIVTEDARLECAGALIPSGMSHTVDSHNEQMLVFMLDEMTVCAEQIKEIRILSRDAVHDIAKDFERMEQHRDEPSAYKNFIAETMNRIGLSDMTMKNMDERIEAAIRFIHTNAGDDLTAQAVARQCCLSESRFSHLFREQVGITFAGYLTLRRTYLAFCNIAAGKSITEAAIEAGFSDSAHFAAVNRKMFGLTATAVSRNLRFYYMGIKL